MATFLDSIDPKRTALLLIEYQNEFTTENGKLHAAVKPVMDNTNMLDNTVALVQKARAKGIKIFHAPITFSDDYRELSTSSYGILGNVKDGQCFLASQWGGEFHPRMTPAATDVVIAGKRGLCAFASTNLDFCLRQNGIETLVIGGFLTNCCVESSMRTAYEKGYVIVPSCVVTLLAYYHVVLSAQRTNNILAMPLHLRWFHVTVLRTNSYPMIFCFTIHRYKVITLTDCTAATSLEQQDAAIKFTFPMFSVPMTSTEFLAKV